MLCQLVLAATSIFKMQLATAVKVAQPRPCPLTLNSGQPDRVPLQPAVFSHYLHHGSIGCLLLENLLPTAAADPGRDAQQQQQSQERVPLRVMSLCSGGGKRWSWKHPIVSKQSV